MYKYLLLLLLIIGFCTTPVNASQVTITHKPLPVTVSRELKQPAKPTLCFDNCKAGQVYVPPTARDGRRMRKMTGIRPKTMKTRRYEKNYARPRSVMKYKNGPSNIKYRTQKRSAYMKRYDSPEYKRYAASKNGPDRISRFHKSCPCHAKRRPIPITRKPQITNRNGITYYNYF